MPEPTKGSEQLFRGTRAELEAWPGTLKAGQPAYETDTHVIRVGDGVTKYKSLPPATGLTLAEMIAAFVQFTGPASMKIEGTPEKGMIPIAQSGTVAKWEREVLTVTETSAESYELAAKDAGTVIIFTGAGKHELKIPAGIFTNKSPTIEVRQMGTGEVRYAGVGGMTIVPAGLSKIAGQYHIIGLAFASGTQTLVSGSAE